MAEQRSVIAFEHGREGTQRFEYFLLGVSVALCTYIGQTLERQRLEFSPYTVGFKRIEKLILTSQLNHDVLHYGEIHGLLMQARGQTWINKESGSVYTPEKTEKKLAEVNQALPVRQKQLETMHEKAQNYYKLRNWLLAAGFITLLLSKILAPYFPKG